MANVRFWLDREIINRHWWQLASVRFARLACGVSFRQAASGPERTLKAPIGVWFLVLDDDLDAGARLEPRSNAPLVSGWFSAGSLTIEQVIRAWP